MTFERRCRVCVPSPEEQLEEREKSKVVDPTPEIYYTGLRTRRPVLWDHRERNRDKDKRDLVKPVGPVKDLELSFCKWRAFPSEE